MHKRSLSAVVVAAHEVGHAMQDATGYAPLQARTRLAKQARKVELLGSVMMLASPVMLVIAKSPAIMVVQIAVGLLVLSFTVLMHVTTLPVEFDASFKRALPVLQGGKFHRRSRSAGGAKDTACRGADLRRRRRHDAARRDAVDQGAALGQTAPGCRVNCRSTRRPNSAAP